MKIHWIPQIDDRPFGRDAVRLDALREWAKAQGVSLPQTSIDLDEFEAVHLESLLNAMSLGVAKMRERDILNAAMKLMDDPAMPALHPDSRRMIEEGAVDHARWFFGQAVAVAWRRYLREAIDSGALPVIDAMTGLPCGPKPIQGQKKRLTAAQEAEVRRRLLAGESQTQLANEMDVSRPTIAKYVPAKPAKAPTVNTPWPPKQTRRILQK